MELILWVGTYGPPLAGCAFPVHMPFAIIIRVSDLEKLAGSGSRVIHEIRPPFSCRDPVVPGYHPEPELDRVFIFGELCGKIFIHFPGCLDPYIFRHELFEVKAFSPDSPLARS